MDSFMNSTLFGEALLQTDEKYPVNDCSLTYTNSCNTIGIATKKHDGKTIYYSLDDDHVKTIIAMGKEHIEE